MMARLFTMPTNKLISIFICKRIIRCYNFPLITHYHGKWFTSASIILIRIKGHRYCYRLKPKIEIFITIETLPTIAYIFQRIF